MLIIKVNYEIEAIILHFDAENKAKLNYFTQNCYIRCKYMQWKFSNGRRQRDKEIDRNLEKRGGK